MDEMDTLQLQETTPESDGQARILRVAYPLFVECGYKSVSMQQIADAAQIHKATLYHHFLNKDAIFKAVVQMSLRQIRSQVTEVIDHGGTAAEQLAQVACHTFVNTQSDIGRLMTDAQENLPAEERHALLRDELFPWDLYEQIFSHAVASGELPEIDIDMAISMFLGLVFGQSWVRRIGRIDAPLDQRIAATIVDTLFAGLRHTQKLNSTALPSSNGRAKPAGSAIRRRDGK
jgi:AcrR family transcriptional regulator